MAQHNQFTGRLYLAKGKDEIYVDVSQILQHQIEGVRFLYRQFKKKKSGLILNDPTRSGKTHQVVLFLNAIKCFLKKPILILCSVHEKNHWLTHFDKLTDFGNGIIVEPPNLSAKGMSVCINTKSNLTSIVNRDWSIVVIDDDCAINEVLKRVFKTEYKIWITSVDMKKNLQIYCKIFGWLCPQEKDKQKVTVQNVQNILSDSKDTQYSLDKHILLDALTEDVVLRRINGLSPLQTQNKIVDVEINVTKKNKDVTGTKTKRSKKINTTNSSISNRSIHSTLKIGDSTSENKSDVDTEQTGNDDNREVHVTMNENMSIQYTEPISNCMPEVLDVLESIKTNESEDIYHNESKSNNDVSYEEKYIEEVNNATEPVTLVGNNLKSDNINQIEHDRNDVHTTDANEQNQRDRKLKSPNKRSPYKDIDDIIRETEEKTMKKYKGSLLDRII